MHMTSVLWYEQDTFFVRLYRELHLRGVEKYKSLHMVWTRPKCIAELWKAIQNNTYVYFGAVGQSEVAVTFSSDLYKNYIDSKIFTEMLTFLCIVILNGVYSLCRQ